MILLGLGAPLAFLTLGPLFARVKESAGRGTSGEAVKPPCRPERTSMQYKQYTIQAFERGLGKWRASVTRADGRHLWNGRAKIRSFVTGIDEATPQRALQMALAAIDGGAFLRQPEDRTMPRRLPHRNAS
jgi:hypothetical protein